jgi:hypothetical protein
MVKEEVEFWNDCGKPRINLVITGDLLVEM